MKRIYFYCAYFFSILAIVYAGGYENSGILEREKVLALLETAENLLWKVGDGFSSCNDEKPSVYLETLKKIISDVRENFPECPKSIGKDDRATINPIEKDDETTPNPIEKDEKTTPHPIEKDDKTTPNTIDKDEKTTPQPIEKDDKTTPNPTEKDDRTTPKPNEKDDKTTPKPVIKDKIIQNNNSADCSEILASGRNKSGVYTIYPSETKGKGKPLQVYCDMKTGNGWYGGWTVIQRRGKYSVQQDFNLNWESYKNGFGKLTQEFWLGNENIRILCHQGCKIRFDLQDAKGEKGFALYQDFKLAKNKKTGIEYILSISGYSGTVGDSMKTHDGFMFTTKDHGRTTRAALFKSGWWHRDAGYDSNLNGVYKNAESDFKGVFWYTWHKNREALKSVEIKVKPKKANKL